MIKFNEVQNFSTSELSRLSAEELNRLIDEAGEAISKAKTAKQILELAISCKYEDRASSLRETLQKDTGVINFEDEDYTVSVDLPKKVDWDQSELKKMAMKITAAGEDPTEFLDISYKVPERKYTAWPEYLKKTFRAARTLKTGKAVYKFKKKGTN